MTIKEIAEKVELLNHNEIIEIDTDRKSFFTCYIRVNDKPYRFGCTNLSKDQNDVFVSIKNLLKI